MLFDGSKTVALTDENLYLVSTLPCIVISVVFASCSMLLDASSSQTIRRRSEGDESPNNYNLYTGQDLLPTYMVIKGRCFAYVFPVQMLYSDLS